MSRSRNFVFTLNNPSEGLREVLREKNFTYLCWGEEVGEQGTPHLQGFFSTKDAHTLKSMIASLAMPMVHLEIMRGTPAQAIAYCQKEGKFFEWGKRPATPAEKGKRGGQAEKERWDTTLHLAKHGRFEDIDAQLQITQFQNLQRVRHAYLKRQQLPDMLSPVLWCWGKTGTGKSRSARAAFPDAYLKTANNKWWCDYNGEEYVLIEDVDRTHDYQGYVFKIWFDRYPFAAEYKGGHTVIRPKLICVTSNYHPSDIWTNESDLDPILRRLKIIEFKEGQDSPLLSFFRINPLPDTHLLDHDFIETQDLISEESSLPWEEQHSVFSASSGFECEWEDGKSLTSDNSSFDYEWEDEED